MDTSEKTIPNSVTGGREYTINKTWPYSDNYCTRANVIRIKLLLTYVKLKLSDYRR